MTTTSRTSAARTTPAATRGRIGGGGRSVLGNLLCVGIVVLVTVGECANLMVREVDFALSNHFSYFTILSNLLIAAVCAWTLVVGRVSDLVRGAAVTFIGLTGVVYHVLLRGDGPETLSSALMHLLVPILALVWWIVAPPSRPLRWSAVVLWMLLPVAYLGYSLLRGPIVDWYPYPIIDPREGGYGHVALGALQVAIAFFAIGTVVMLVGNALRRVAR